MKTNRAARIIIVEDRPESVFLAKTALESEGILNLVEFFTGSDSVLAYLDANRNEPPDLILIDRNLIGSPLDGDGIAEAIIADDAFRNCEIGMMSAAYASREKENEYADNPRIRFFLKTPLISAQLDAVIRSSSRLRKLIVVVDSEKAAA